MTLETTRTRGRQERAGLSSPGALEQLPEAVGVDFAAAAGVVAAAVGAEDDRVLAAVVVEVARRPGRVGVPLGGGHGAAVGRNQTIAHRARALPLHAGRSFDGVTASAFVAGPQDEAGRARAHRQLVLLATGGHADGVDAVAVRARQRRRVP